MLALKYLKQKYSESLERRDKLSREIFAIRAMVNMPELYLDKNFNIVGSSVDFPFLTKKIYEFAHKRMHIKEFIGEDDYKNIDKYLKRIKDLEDLPYDKGKPWRLRYKGPNPSDEIGKSWIPYKSAMVNNWEIIERDGMLRIVHKPHLEDEVDCFLMIAEEYGGADEDIKIIYKAKTSRIKKNIRDLSVIISGASGLEATNPDFLGYTICSGSDYNKESRIQRKGANVFVCPEVLEPDTEYEITAERTGGKIRRELRNLRTQKEAPPLEIIDSNAVYDGQNHIGFTVFSADAEFYDIEVYTRKSRFSIEQFKIPFDFEVGIKDKRLKGRVFKLRLSKDESMGRFLYMLMFEDITDRKEAEEALRESEEKYRTLFEESKDALCTTTLDGKFIDFNQALLDMLGYTREEMLKLNVRQIYVSPRDRDLFQREIEKKDFIRDYEVKLKKKNGTEMDCQLTTTVRRDKKGRIWGYQSNITDITERKRLAPKLRPCFGSSPMMTKVMELASLAAETDTTISLMGETGTGKGVLAQWIHDHSNRRYRSFVAINCSSLKGEMLASELFGHTRGAYTSAVQERRGLIQIADGGTLFLDEISNMSLSVQAEFLKVIEEKQYRRLGEDKTRKSDFRLICSTNKDLFEETRQERFRQDLYFRIHVFPIYIPPLKKILTDLPGLVWHILGLFGASHLEISPEVMKLLATYSWPGNIRELRNVLERAVLLAKGSTLSTEHFPGLGSLSLLTELYENKWDLKCAEKSHIIEVINRCDGDKTKAAKALGISRATIYRKLGKLSNNP
ncbi:MAG TPA: sigma 54-interacting transcriptional regulator [archaeon]|nr:sigma 54-interacting transcriptional regulator [archaeon]